MNTKASSKPAPLGRGLSALFGDTDASYRPGAAANAVEKTATPETIPLAWIRPGAFQPRRRFQESAIDELAESIRHRGVIQPLLVRPLPGEQNAYEIIAGERRWRAAARAGIHDIPVLVRTMSDKEAMEVGLIENVQRQDLSPLEEAEGYKRLLEEFSHTQEGLARIVGKSRPHITNLLRLLTLPDPVKNMIDDGQLTMGHARALVTVDDPFALAQEIVKKGMNVRQAEALAQKASNGKFAKKKTVSKAISADILAIEQDLERLVGLKVKLAPNGTAGSLTFFYRSLDQLDGLIDRLKD